MATEDQLLQAFKAAADSGDEPAARAFAAELQKLRAPAQPEPVEGTPSVSKAPIDMSDGIGDYAREAVGAFAKSAGRFGAYTTEGFTRAVVDSPGQLSAAGIQAVGDLYDKVRPTKVSELVTGKKPSLEFLKRYNEAVEFRRQQVRDEYERTYNEPFPETLTKVSEVVNGFLGTSGLSGSATSGFLGTVAQGAKTGAVLGPVTYTKEADVNDKIGQSLIGGLFGAGVGAVTGGFQYLKNSLFKYLNRDPVPKSQAAAKVLEDPQEMFGGMKAGMSPGQRTGNVQQQQFESKSGDARALQEQLLNQAKEVRAGVERAVQKYGPDLSPQEIADKGQLALDAQLKKLSQIRGDIFKSDLGLIRTKLAVDAGVPTEAGGQVLVKIPGLDQRVRSVLGSSGNKITDLSDDLQGYLAKYQNNGGALQFDDLTDLLRKLNERNYSPVANAGGNANSARLARDLRKSVFSSLDDIAESSEVGKLLRQARDTYKAQSKQISNLQKSSLASALGINKKTGELVDIDNPEEALSKLLSLSPSQQRKAAGLLKSGDGEVLNNLRAYNLQQALNQASPTGKLSDPGLDVQKFINLTVGDGKLRGAGFYSPKDVETFTKNFNALRALLNKADYKSPVAEAEGIGMTLAGAVRGVASAPFAARTLIRLSGGGGLGKILFDPKAQKEFFDIQAGFGSKSVAATRAASQAAARLEAMLDGDLEEEE